MTTNTCSVGEGIAAALIRAEQLREASARHPRVRITTASGDGHLTITARIAARTDEELAAQANLGTRRIPFAELDARAPELVALVEEAVGEVEQAVQKAPSPPERPTRVETGLDEEVLDCFTEACAKALTEEATALLKSPVARTLSLGVAGEAVMKGALRLAALAAYSARITLEDATEDLREALNDVRSRAGKGASHLLRAQLDS
jgi:hypothetical protein